MREKPWRPIGCPEAAFLLPGGCGNPGAHGPGCPAGCPPRPGDVGTPSLLVLMREPRVRAPGRLRHAVRPAREARPRGAAWVRVGLAEAPASGPERLQAGASWCCVWRGSRGFRVFQIIVFRNNDLSAVVIFPKESACSSISLSRTCGPGQRLEGTGRGGASRGGRRLGGIAARPVPGRRGCRSGGCQEAVPGVGAPLAWAKAVTCGLRSKRRHSENAGHCPSMGDSRKGQLAPTGRSERGRKWEAALRWCERSGPW